MGVPPKGMSLGRINNERGYAPGNCRWETPLQQAQNTRSTKFYTYKGERHCLSEWARRLGTNPSTLRVRILRHGIEEAFNWGRHIQDKKDKRTRALPENYMVIHNGTGWSAAALAKKYDISPDLFLKHIITNGVEAAINFGIAARARKKHRHYIEHRGFRWTLSKWAMVMHMSRITLARKLKNKTLDNIETEFTNGEFEKYMKRMKLYKQLDEEKLL